jgi:hypothetical protein
MFADIGTVEVVEPVTVYTVTVPVPRGLYVYPHRYRYIPVSMSYETGFVFESTVYRYPYVSIVN